jgi:SAM-dependent methyltransferase
MPLGVGLANELRNLQVDTDAPARNIVSEIICIDYSQIVIDEMNKLFGEGDLTLRNDVDAVTCDSKTTKPMEQMKDIAVKFAVADARMLPYDNGSFELILEKGTLDAMLSDNECGLSNCIQTVSECARLLTPNTSQKDPKSSLNESIIGVKSSSKNGCLLVVSHLNANNDKGMRWLNDIVVAGLLQYSQMDQMIEWEIEVHGKSETEKDDGQSDPETELLGPAVYIIHKRLNESNRTLHPIAENETDGNSKQNISINFFSY